MALPGGLAGLACTLVLAACSPYGTGGAFHCTEDAQCAGGTGPGQCEDNGYCSFPDDNCASGRSYGGLSGSLAHVCVGAEPMVDGPRDDMSNESTINPGCLDAWLNDTIRFDPPVELTAVNTTSFERDPFVSPDELTIYVSSARPGSAGSDTWVATRATLAAPFGTPTNSTIFSTAGNETKASFTANGLLAVVGSDQAGGAGGVDVWETSRATLTDAFGPLVRTHELVFNTTSSDHDPTISATGLRLYASPAAPAPQHIVVGSRASLTDNFSAGVPIAELAGGAGDADPSVTPDERIIVFSSNRTLTGFTNTNIWYATRAGATGTFSAPKPVPDVNSNFADGDAHLSTDGCRIYFSRDVGGATGWDIYMATAH